MLQKRSQEFEKEKQDLLERVSCIEDLNKEQNQKLMKGAAVADELASVKVSLGAVLFWYLLFAPHHVVDATGTETEVFVNNWHSGSSQ